MKNNEFEMIKEKEEEFMDQFMDMTLTELYDLLELSQESIEVADINRISNILQKAFAAKMLIVDEDFQELTVHIHLIENDGTEFWGLSVIDRCGHFHCKNEVCIWYGLIFSKEKDILKLDFYSLPDNNSEYTRGNLDGEPMHSVRSHILETMHREDSLE